ncbi:mannosylphosphorylation (Mnn4) [Pyrenophora seminiperda CCB06]|uniref:Mannosylphosphorylation (Mnn4) n=1 Tax=Pyrenophora seminiperda CCB06 TaxID=1302712 RepID=A0A3M7MCC0_9PLEO|nr:mannosylphosphorylation (Mnn4) [Pyrenophora seminiperda CCB06]
MAPIAANTDNSACAVLVQATFGFNFGALAARPAKQASLTPRLSSRRTPVQRTPRAANGSAQRHRSASIQRSSAAKRKSTPREETVTPRLGKRKRGSSHAEPGPVDADEDELSPDREERARSIEKSRRVVGTVSPVREEQDNVPDELSILHEGTSTVRDTVFAKSTVMKRTPPQALAQKRTSPANAPQQTPIPDRGEAPSVASRKSLTRRSKSTDPIPATPSLPASSRSKVSSASRSEVELATPIVAPADDESEDELSPQLNVVTPRVIGSEPRPQPTTLEETQMDMDELSPQPNVVTPQAIGSEPRSQSTAQEETQMDMDELSSLMQQTPTQKTSIVNSDAKTQAKEDVSATASQPAKRGRPRKVAAPSENEPQAIAIMPKPNLNKRSEPAADEAVDELSPERVKTVSISPKPVSSSKPTESVSRKEELEDMSSVQEESAEDEEPSADETEIIQRPMTKRRSPKQVAHNKPLVEKQPSRKRQKFLGPKHAISVMRIKGSVVRGITVADTTRTVLEETIDHRLNRMAERLQTSQDSDRRKILRSEINLSLSFKESLNEKLLDLQDANDVLSTNFKKMKQFKRDNAELRKEILSLQNSREEIAIEQDYVQAHFETEKAKVDIRNTLSDNMFDIEAAIKNGREQARKEGRENEGPEIPLSILLETVANHVGSRGGGLLANVKSFNGLLEKAAGWLEGRA